LLPKREKIASGKEIKGVMKRRKYQAASPLIQITAEENGQANSRMAIICRKELGTAVERNRVRRRIEAELIKMRADMNIGLDAIIIPRGKKAQCGEIMNIIIKRAYNASNPAKNN
jgi:ribonuclease P protein component